MSVPVLTIEQVESPRRKLTVRGLAAPRGSLSWPVRQRGEIRRGPGHEGGTAYLDGPDDQPIPMTFTWDDRQLERESLVEAQDEQGRRELARGRDVVAFVDAMTRDPVLAVATWNGIARVGYVEEFEPSVLSGFNERWRASLRFAVLHPGDQPKPTTAAPAQRDFSDRVAGWRTQWSNALGNAARPPAFVKSQMTDVESAAGSLTTAVNQATRVADEYRGAELSAPEMAGPLTSAARAVQTSCLALESAAGTSPVQWVERTDAVAQVAAGRFVSLLCRTARQIRHDAGLEIRRLGRYAERWVDGVHIAADGEDLRVIAWTYGYPTEFWREIARRNGLTSTQCSGGERILLPRMVA